MLQDFEVIKRLGKYLADLHYLSFSCILLGEGAYSSVFKVRRYLDGAIYALKQVKMSNLSEKEKENALNEVRILASI